MLKGLLVSMMFLLALPTILAVPWTGALIYIWVEYTAPQGMYYSAIAGWPTSMIVAVLTLLSWAAFDRKHIPNVTAILVVALLFVAWITFTTQFAVLPDAAAVKWDKAYKAILFACFLSYLIRTRVQIEAFLWVWILSVGFTTIPGAAKTILGGGGGYTVVATADGSDLSESSTLAMVCVLVVPLLKFLYDHMTLVPRNWLWKLFMIGVMLAQPIAMLGTNARTGLVAATAGVAMFVMKLRRRFWTILALAVVIPPLIIYVAPQQWHERMATLEDYENEASAANRLATWSWAIDYVTKTSPIMGGGFRVFDTSSVRNSLGGSIAAHSIYFEVLGEQGFVGLAIYVTSLLLTLFKLLQIQRRAKPYPELLWLRDLAAMMQVSMVAYMVGGAFIGVAYQTMLYTMMALTISMDQFLWRSIVLAPPRFGIERPARPVATTPSAAFGSDTRLSKKA
jgi:probable O-glycosylation ligase (exosortase A-associated)